MVLRYVQSKILQNINLFLILLFIFYLFIDDGDDDFGV